MANGKKWLAPRADIAGFLAPPLWFCAAVDRLGRPACALSASEATKATVVSMTLCRVGYFIGRELIRNSGFMSRLFFGVCRSQNRGSPPHTYICAISVPWPGLKKRLPMATPNFKTRRVLRGQPFIIAL